VKLREKNSKKAKSEQRIKSGYSKIKSEVLQMYVRRLQNYNCKTNFYHI